MINQFITNHFLQINLVISDSQWLITFLMWYVVRGNGVEMVRIKHYSYYFQWVEYKANWQCYLWFSISKSFKKENVYLFKNKALHFKRF